MMVVVVVDGFYHRNLVREIVSSNAKDSYGFCNCQNGGLIFHFGCARVAVWDVIIPFSTFVS